MYLKQLHCAQYSQISKMTSFGSFFGPSSDLYTRIHNRNYTIIVLYSFFYGFWYIGLMVARNVGQNQLPYKCDSCANKTNLTYNLFLVYFINLYMFQACLGSSSGGTTVCVQQLVIITREKKAITPILLHSCQTSVTAALFRGGGPTFSF